jgi:hypothetical protein
VFVTFSQWKKKRILVSKSAALANHTYNVQKLLKKETRCLVSCAKTSSAKIKSHLQDCTKNVRDLTLNMLSKFGTPGMHFGVQKLLFWANFVHEIDPCVTLTGTDLMTAKVSLSVLSVMMTSLCVDSGKDTATSRKFDKKALNRMLDHCDLNTATKKRQL